MRIRISLLLFLVLTLTRISFAQSYTVSGFITDADTGESLVGANIWDRNSETGTLSNDYGFFTLTVPSGSVSIVGSYVGYQSDTITLLLTKSERIKVSLVPTINLNTVEISSAISNPLEREVATGILKLTTSQIKELPSFLGETDVLKTLQLLPGIQSGNEAQTGLYVRGGSPDQNLILLDGITVYNASHLFGFFSVFNTDAISSVSAIKGGFPARYGGRLSSVIDIRMKEGNSKEWGGSASLGLISSKFTFEGPIKKDKTSIILSARRTYFDVLAKPFIKRSFSSDDVQGDVGYYFYDLNLKINHHFSDQDRIFLSFYSGYDDYNKKENTSSDIASRNLQSNLGWGNSTAALRWNHVWSNKLFSNTTATFSHFNFETGDAQTTSVQNQNDVENIGYKIFYQSGITDISIRQDFDYSPNSKHFMRFGGQFINHSFKPGEFDQSIFINTTDLNFQQDTVIDQGTVDALEWMVYWEDEFRPIDNFYLNFGLHYSGYQITNDIFHSFQPRLSMRYEFSNKLGFKASFSRMRQYIQLLTNSSVGLPTDLWLPTTNRVKPQDAWQSSLGLFKNFNTGLESSIEVFYKSMDEVLAYKPGASLFDLNDWQDRVIQGKGESYGIELFVKKNQGRLKAWLSYTLSWSWRKFADIDNGERFPFRYDRRHDLSLTSTFNITDNLTIAGAWVFGSGHALTLPRAFYPSITNYTFSEYSIFPAYDYGKRNSFRIPAFHRLDLNLNLRKQRKHFEEIWSLGFYNAYGRRNPFYLTLSTGNIVATTDDGDPIQKSNLNQVSLFPILPSFSYQINF